MARRPLVPGRPGRSPVLTVRTTPDTLDLLDRVAQAEGRRRSEVARDALDEALRARLGAAG